MPNIKSNPLKTIQYQLRYLIQRFGNLEVSNEDLTLDALLEDSTFEHSHAIVEELTVVNDLITLSHTPKNGLFGILNFSTVRLFETHIEGLVVFDALVAPTANERVFKVETDTPGEWDGKRVKIQYLYNHFTD